MHLKTLENQGQSKHRVCTRKAIIQLRVKINQMEAERLVKFTELLATTSQKYMPNDWRMQRNGEIPRCVWLAKQNQEDLNMLSNPIPGIKMEAVIRNKIGSM